MFENSKKVTSICNYICAGLMLLLLLLQFTPFWKYGSEKISIQSYVWFPTSHTDLTSYLAEKLGESYAIEQIISMPIWTLVLGVCGLVLCLIWHQKFLCALIPAACGAIGIWGYMTKSAFQLGTNWGLHLAVCVIMLLTAAFAFVINLKELKRMICS